MTSKPPSARPFRGVPADERQRVRRAALLDATLDVLADKGRAGTTIDRIAATAQLTKRYFYENFASLDEAIEAVIEREIASIAVGALPIIATSGWRNPRPIVEYLCRATMSDRRRIYTLLRDADLLPLNRHDFMNRAVDVWFSAESDKPVEPRDREIARVLALSYIGAVVEVLTAWADDELTFTEDEVTEYLVLLFQRIAPIAPGEPWTIKSS